MQIRRARALCNYLYTLLFFTAQPRLRWVMRAWIRGLDIFGALIRWGFGICLETLKSVLGLWNRAWDFEIGPETLKSGLRLWNRAWGFEIWPETLKSGLRLWNRAWGFEIGLETLKSGLRLWNRAWGFEISLWLRYSQDFGIRFGGFDISIVALTFKVLLWYLKCCFDI